MSLSAGDKWTQKADMPTQRLFTSAATVNGKIYVIEGQSSVAGSAISSVEEYDPATDKWTKKTDMPTPRIRFSVCAVNGKIYAIGGAPTNTGAATLATVEVYDSMTDTWEKKTDMPTARHSLSLSVVDGLIYAIGGGSGSIAWKNAVPQVPAPVEVYNPTTDRWMPKSSMPTARFEHTSGVVRGKIYVIGGAKDGNNVVARVEVYDPTTDRWTRKADMPTARYIYTVSAVNNKLYAIGGAIPIPAWWTILRTVEAYDPTTDRWEKKTDMLTARTDPSRSVVNGKIYVFGGWAGADGLATVEEYTPDGWSFAALPQSRLITTWGTIKQDR